MDVFEYIKDKIFLILGQILCMMLLFFYLTLTGYPVRNSWLLITVWGIIFLVYLVVEYLKRKRYFKRIQKILNELDQPYLLAEVMQTGQKLEDRLYRNIIRKSNKSVIEQIHQVETDRNEYKEFIESWVHEIKRPVTVIQLICENQKDSTTRKIMSELVKVEQYIDTALFYARADQVYQDYLIRQVDLKTIVTSVLAKNKLLLIENQVSCSVHFEEVMVPSDGKWVEFILNQIIVNAVKYRKEENPRIEFSMEEVNGFHQKSLIIYDNGIGIPECDVRRVFDKGFTGSNGRNREKATGIGLYLCKRLCDKLELGITVNSVEGEYTKIILTFPCLEKLM